MTTELYLLDGPAAHTRLAVPSSPPPEWRVALQERTLAPYSDYDDPSFARSISGVYIPVARAVLYRFDGLEVEG